MKKYRKPYRIKKRKSILKSRFLWLTVLSLILLGTVFYFLIFSSTFQIKEIKISGNQKVRTEDLREKISPQIIKSFWKLSSKSIFLVNLNRIKENFFENFPQIAEINLRREFPNSLILEIEERKPLAVWCPSEKCFFIDKEGIIFEEVFEIPQNYLKIKEPGEREFSLGKKVIKEEKFNSILEIGKNLKENLKINTEEFILSNEQRLNIKTTEKFEIYFNLRENLEWQLTKLSLVLEKEIPLEKRGELEYIDLRFSRVYYKYRE